MWEEEGRCILVRVVDDGCAEGECAEQSRGIGGRGVSEVVLGVIGDVLLALQYLVPSYSLHSKQQEAI